MTFEQLHEIIHGLSENQRNHFTRFIGKDVNSSKYYLLYKRILGVAKLDAGSEAAVRGKEFARSAYFAGYRTGLLDKILQSMASQQDVVVASNTYFERAIAYGAFSLAKKSLFGRMTVELEREAYFELQACHALLRETRRVYRVEWKVPEGIPSDAVVQRTCAQITLLEDLTARVVKGLQSGEGFVVPPEVLAQVEEMEMVSHKERYLAMGLRTKMCLQGKDYLGATVAQRALVDAMLSGEVKCLFLLEVREVISLIRLALITNDERLAMEYNSKLADLQVDHIRNQDYFSLVKLDSSVSVALSTYNKDLVLIIYQELMDLSTSRDYYNQVYLLYFSALVLLYNSEFEKAKNILAKLRNQFSKTQLKRFYWATEVLYLLCHFELGTDDILERGLPNCERKFRKSYPGYPMTIVRTLRKLYINSTYDVSIMETALEEIETIRLNGDEPLFFNFFDFSFWLKEKLGHGDALSSALAERNAEDWLSLEQSRRGS